MHGLMHDICTQTGRGSDTVSGCQTDFTILNPLTSAVTHIFPFSDEDVFCFHGSIVARDLERVPVLADNSLQTAHCKGAKQSSEISITLFQLQQSRKVFDLKLKNVINLKVSKRHLSVPLSVPAQTQLL